MNKAYNYRIYPTDEQKEFFSKCFGCARFIYNKLLEDKIDYYKKYKKMFKNTPAMYKEQYEWLKEVDSLALSNAQLNLDKAYRAFWKDKGKGFPKFKTKHKSRMSYTTNNQKGTIRIEEGKLRLPKIKSTIKVVQHRMIPETEVIKNATISMTKTGKYYVSIVVEYNKELEQQVVVKDNQVVGSDHHLIKVIGLDYSMKELYVANNGDKGNYPKYYKKTLEKLKREQRKLSHCKKGSKNRAKQRLKVAKIHEKIANQRQDYEQKQSRQIANAYDVVVIESLDLKEMSKEYGKSVYDNSYGAFTKMLEYKLQDQGKQLIKIDKWYPSSKTCSQCGVVKPSFGVHRRVYECACGYIEDRDVNAGINIKREGIRLLLDEAC